MDVGIVVAIVFGVLFLGALVGLICLAVMWEPPSPEPKDYVYFDKFTAESITLSCDSSYYYDSLRGTVPFHYSDKSKEYVFSPDKWYNEGYDKNDKVISRVLSTKNDDTIIDCSHMGSHDYCYARSFGGDGSFSIPQEAEITGTGADNCLIPSVFQKYMPNRKLTDCTSFGLSSAKQNVVVVYYVDTNTGYPILTQTTSIGFSSTQIETKIYTSFKPEKPSDESDLKPFPGVTIYDLRNGMGDAGDGKSNIYVESSEVKQFDKGTYKRKGFGSVKQLFDAVEEYSENKNRFDVFKKEARRNQAIRDFLHLPPTGIVGSQSLSVQNTVSVRDVRDIPASFDAREHWSNCKSVIGTITDQNPCGSCWAMSSSAVLADRRCIANNANKLQLSPQYMVYCSMNNSGCYGGTTLPAWDYLTEIGTVPESCVPFTAHDGKCPTRCENGDLITESMFVKASKTIVLPWGNSSEERVRAIQSEIMTNGPVQASFRTFSDYGAEYFYGNPTRIYHRSKEATLDGGHAVRIIGWGSEGGVDYWLIANSWGLRWGDDGIFRMRRGNNECNLEEDVAATVFA
jgi:cathepsin B